MDGGDYPASESCWGRSGYNRTLKSLVLLAVLFKRLSSPENLATKFFLGKTSISDLTIRLYLYFIIIICSFFFFKGNDKQNVRFVEIAAVPFPSPTITS